MNLYSQSLFLVHYVFRPSGPDHILNKTGYKLSNGNVEMSERLKSCCAGCRRLACGWRHRGSQRPRRVLLWMTSEQGEQIWISWTKSVFLLLLSLALPSCLRWRHSSPQTLRPCTSAPSTRRWPVRCWRRWRWSKWWGRGWSWCRVTDTQGSNVVMMNGDD